MDSTTTLLDPPPLCGEARVDLPTAQELSGLAPSADGERLPILSGGLVMRVE